jgi:hypothetical protein
LLLLATRSVPPANVAAFRMTLPTNSDAEMQRQANAVSAETVDNRDE